MSRNSSNTRQGAVGRPVSQVRSKERNRVVAPVVRQPGRRFLGIKLKNGQQFDRRDPQFLQVGNLLDQAGVSTTLVLRATPELGCRVNPRDMHFVDDRFVETVGTAACHLPSRRWRSATTLFIAYGRVVAGRAPASRSKCLGTATARP